MTVWLQAQLCEVVRWVDSLAPEGLDQHSMSKAFRLAHISDVHLPNVAGFWPRHWNLKRALGAANWYRKRRLVHRWETIDLLLQDLREQNCDHIAVSGDLANIGLPSELEAATTWLQQLGSHEDVSLVPGNHDIYCPLWSDIGTQRWQNYMRSCETGQSLIAGSAAEDFPYLRIVGPIALIGVNSAVPTPPGIASGRVGALQLERLRQLLVRLQAEDYCRVVMVHHPPLPGQATSRRALEDAGSLKAVLEEAGADLVIHGHNHRNMLVRCTRQERLFPIVGVPSFSVDPKAGHGEPAAYNIYEINVLTEGHAITLRQRGLKPDAKGVFELRNEQIL